MTPDRAWLAFTVALTLVAWLWWTHRTYPADYGPDWTERRKAWWDRHGRYCHCCHGAGDECHHKFGNGHRWKPGHEPDRALIGLCLRCHDKITDLARQWRHSWLRHWLSGPTITHLATSLVLFLFLPWRIIRRRPAR